MKITKTLSLIGCAALLALSPYARATEGDDIEKQETQLEEAAKGPDYVSRLQKRYGLSDDQIKKLQDAGMNNSQITIAAQLAKSSGRPIDEIMKMRLEQKQGWGKIAKELGVPPKEIGQSIADMHRNERSEKHKERVETRHDRAERAQERRERVQEKRERAQERAERKANRKG